MKFIDNFSAMSLMLLKLIINGSNIICFSLKYKLDCWRKMKTLICLPVKPCCPPNRHNEGLRNWHINRYVKTPFIYEKMEQLSYIHPETRKFYIFNQHC